MRAPWQPPTKSIQEAVSSAAMDGVVGHYGYFAGAGSGSPPNQGIKKILLSSTINSSLQVRRFVDNVVAAARHDECSCHQYVLQDAAQVGLIKLSTKINAICKFAFEREDLAEFGMCSGEWKWHVLIDGTLIVY